MAAVPHFSIEDVNVDFIETPDGRRSIDDRAVDGLAESISRLGLISPLCVQYIPDRPGQDGTEDSFILVTGAHRLAAIRRLEWEQVSCKVFDASVPASTIRMMEISENLHRSDLTIQQRSEQIEEWRKLAATERGEKFSPLGGVQPHQNGVKQTARELGIAPAEVRNAAKIDKLSSDAKEAAQELGFDDKQSVLLAAKAAGGNDAAKEVAFLRTEHARREAERERKEVEKLNKDHDRVIALTEAEDFANWLLARSDLSELPTLLSWLEHFKCKDVAAAVRRASA